MLGNRSTRLVKRWSLLVCLVVALSSLPVSIALADTFVSVTPQRCVTLREGQPCFIRLRLVWEADPARSVCAYGVDVEPLACWQDSRGDVLVVEQRLLKNTPFTLRDADGVEVATTSVTVAWVYKSRRTRRRWRLF